MARKKSSCSGCLGCVGLCVLVGMMCLFGLAVIGAYLERQRIASMTPEERQEYERQRVETKASYDADRAKHKAEMDEFWKRSRESTEKHFAAQRQREAEREAVEKPKQDLERKTGQRRRSDLRSCFDYPNTVTVDWYPETWHLKTGGIVYKGTVSAKNGFNLEIDHTYRLEYDKVGELIHLTIGDEVFVGE